MWKSTAMSRCVSNVIDHRYFTITSYIECHNSMMYFLFMFQNDFHANIFFDRSMGILRVDCFVKKTSLMMMSYGLVLG